MSAAEQRPGDPQRRAYWLKTLHRWHWISSALCLIGMLVFSVTGITLNHAAQISATPQTVTRSAQLPDALRDRLARLARDAPIDTPLPPDLVAWASNELDVQLAGRTPEWSSDELYVSLPRAGGDGWIAIDLGTGSAELESTDRGWVSYFNDLHKGRNTGPAWSWFIDLFAVACLVFCITGLFLLQLHARQRGLTWPMVGLGLLIPLLLLLLLVH
jgi:uncharacterized protein